jgi:hypothetical protein
MLSEELLSLLRDAADGACQPGSALADEADRKAGVDARRGYTLALQECRAASALQPKDASPIVEWAKILTRFARILPNAEAFPLLDEAIARLRRAVELQADAPQAFEAWGSALRERAARTSGDAAHSIFVEAGKQYLAALQIQPRSAGALSGASVVREPKGDRWPRPRSCGSRPRPFTIKHSMPDLVFTPRSMRRQCSRATKPFGDPSPRRSPSIGCQKRNRRLLSPSVRVRTRHLSVSATPS